MKYCINCIQPDTRPNTKFLRNGLCPACNYFTKLQDVDWHERFEILQRLVRRNKITNNSKFKKHYPKWKIKYSLNKIIEEMDKNN